MYVSYVLSMCQLEWAHFSTLSNLPSVCDHSKLTYWVQWYVDVVCYTCSVCVDLYSKEESIPYQHAC